MENSRKIWFKRRFHGWGWYPVSKEGWLVTVIYMAIIMVLTTAVAKGANTKEWWLFFALPVILTTISFIRLAYKYGEKPRWQWSKNKNDR